MLETEKETTRKKGGKKILAVLVAVAMAVAVFIFFQKKHEWRCIAGSC
jgi:flagellar basal body-associated protein FliL